MSLFPVTSRLTFPEALKGAIITRAAVSGARLTMTWKAPNEGFTKEQKSASFLERCFMEPVGVLVQVMMLYLTQDAVAHGFSRMKWLARPDAKALEAVLTNPTERKVLADAIHQHYTSPTPQLLAKMQYEAKDTARLVEHVKDTVKSKLRNNPQALERVKTAIYKVLETGYHQRLKYATAAMLGLGVLSSAYFSGSLMQWMNDNVVAHRLIPWINTKLGLVSQSQSSGVQPAPQYIPTPSDQPGALAMSSQGISGVPMSQYAPPTTLRAQA